jgi:hypothetical protein
MEQSRDVARMREGGTKERELTRLAREMEEDGEVVEDEEQVVGLLDNVDAVDENEGEGEGDEKRMVEHELRKAGKTKNTFAGMHIGCHLILLLWTLIFCMIVFRNLIPFPQKIRPVSGLSLDGENHLMPQSQQCGRTWPIWPKWHFVNDSSRSIYTTNSCILPPFPSKENMTQCLQGRNIYLLGNSIARQFAYHVPLLLGSTNDVPDRESQKKNCPKEIGAGGCSIDVSLFDLRVRSFWFLYWNGKPRVGVVPNTAVLKDWEVDICGEKSTYDCIRDDVMLTNGSLTSDILVTNVGIIYTLLDPIGIHDVATWRKDELRVFIRVLNDSFNGTIVWMTQSKMSPTSEGDWFHAYEDVRSQQLDSQVVPIILEETDWTIYDGYHITEPLAHNKDYFADSIHHPGRLTHLGWQFILAHICSV